MIFSHEKAQKTQNDRTRRTKNWFELFEMPRFYFVIFVPFRG